jgi:biotin carboxyl carrier protein
MRSHVVPHDHGEKARTSKPTDKKGAGVIKAPLPGTILEIKVKPGDEVKMGDDLLIMEAMKMENNIKSDKYGKISDIKVSVGDSVLEGEVLVEIGN